MGRSFRPNHDGFRRMAVGDEVRGAVVAEAMRARETAKAMAEEFRVTGDYADSFEVTTTDTQLRTAFGEHAVATATLENVSDHAAAVEWGNANDGRAHHVLSRALESLGHG